MAARKRTATAPGTMPQRWRDKIRTTMLIKRLETCVQGKVDLSGPQVTAAIALLRKTLPDLTENDTKLSGDITIVRRALGD